LSPNAEVIKRAMTRCSLSVIRYEFVSSRPEHSERCTTMNRLSRSRTCCCSSRIDRTRWSSMAVASPVVRKLKWGVKSTRHPASRNSRYRPSSTRPWKRSKGISGTSTEKRSRTRSRALMRALRGRRRHSLLRRGYAPFQHGSTARNAVTP
jgi:hypothetical protein